MGMVKRLAEGHERSKAIYIVPLKALAMEKYEDLRNLVMRWGSVGLGIGDATAEAKNIDECKSLCAPRKNWTRCFVIGLNSSPILLRGRGRIPLDERRHSRAHA